MFVILMTAGAIVYARQTTPAPKPGIHNSGWIQDPGDVMFTHPEGSPVRAAMMANP